MAAGRSSKNLVGRRRRVDDEDEDEGPVLIDDSQSEGSAPGEIEDDGDASTLGGDQVVEGDRHAAVSTNGHKTVSRRSGKKNKHAENTEVGQTAETATPAPAFAPTADTEAMLRGLKVEDNIPEAVDYEKLNTDNVRRGHESRHQTDHPKKEHEEYKKQRDADPAFIPNRGGFFMHDTRGHHSNGPAPFRGQPGRGRGRGYFTQESGHISDKPLEQAWKHDLHESINENASQNFDQGGKSSARLFGRPTQQDNTVAAEPLSFSTTTLLGRVQLRIFLPGMSKAITYSEVPLKKYTRLPDHRPPLRRDKPLRIFLPHIGPKYIFPATERSFIFIPRQLRPNQRGFNNQQQRNVSGYGYSSRRTSMYGGSVYSNSIAASRRSSIVRDREGMFSPGSYAGGYQPPSRPVVRLPRSGQYYDTSTPPMHSFSGQQTPVHQIHTYPLPQQPAFQGTPTTTVQHPRPQKAISVSGIESPAALTQRQTPTEQPFHSQLPHHLTDTAPVQYYSPRQQYAYPAMGQISSPLSQIPEQAVHAQSYQPQQMYPYAQQPYYYGSMPMYMMPQQQPGYMYASAGAAQQTMPYQQAVDPTQPPSGMVAHESNGMVFYMPASDTGAPSNNEQYQPAEAFTPNYQSGPDQNGQYYNAMFANSYYPGAQ